MIQKNQLIEELKKADLFSRLEADDLAALLGIARMRQVDDGEILLTQRASLLPYRRGTRRSCFLRNRRTPRGPARGRLRRCTDLRRPQRSSPVGRSASGRSTDDATLIRRKASDRFP